jgi:steroid 5-alpha reductase family enzyme
MELLSLLLQIIQSPIFIHGLILVLAYLALMFTIIEVKQDASIGNFTWGGMVLLIAIYTFFAASSYLPRQILATALIFMWCSRLATYAYLRYRKGADPRFVQWKEQKGALSHLFDFGWIFILNGFMGTVMSAIIITINTQLSGPLNWLDGLAVVLWLIGFYFESVSDYQLYVFRKDPNNKDKILSTGLWRYSRHPNYFGEIVMWWSMYLIALSMPYGYLTIITPGAITISLLFVTGIPWLEKAMASNPEYQEYKKRTSILIPMPPKETL